VAQPPSIAARRTWPVKRCPVCMPARILKVRMGRDSVAAMKRRRHMAA
jgi:hypothetical protein